MDKMDQITLISPPISVGQIAYGISKKMVSVMEQCKHCKGVGSLVVDDSTFICEHCKGTGSEVSSRIEKWTVDDMEYVITTIKATMSKDGATYRYKCSNGKFRSNLFGSIEEAMFVCDNRNKVYQHIPMEDIKIPKYFASTIPQPEKIAARVREIKESGRFNTTVTINKDGLLTDGYTAYLVAKMFDFAVLKAEVI